MNPESPSATTEAGKTANAPAADTHAPESPTRTSPPGDHPGTVEFDSRNLVKPEIPGYEIEHVLARGGMGVVFKARQVELERPVAVKMVLGGAYASDAALQRFRAEAVALGQLQHPHIVHIYHVGQHEGMPYLVLEFCGGGTLGNRIDRGPLSHAAAAELIETLARAVHAAHERGIVHRDLKPHNVLFTSDGTPKLTDFGLAKRLDAQAMTKSDVIMGTPGYMAPEQAGGQSKQVGPPADIYGLGAMLYATLIGKPPFEADSQLATMLQVLTQDPPSPSSIRGDVPPSLEAICLKCLAKKPEDRYPSALALADDLKRFRGGDPVSATAPATVHVATVSEIVSAKPQSSEPPRPAPAAPSSRRKQMMIGGAALLILLVGLLIWRPWAFSVGAERAYRDLVFAMNDLAEKVNSAAPPEDRQQAFLRYKAAESHWRDLKLSYDDRKAIENRYKDEFTAAGKAMANAFEGKSHIEEVRKMMSGMGDAMTDMLQSWMRAFGKDGGSSFPGFNFPSIPGISDK